MKKPFRRREPNITVEDSAHETILSSCFSVNCLAKTACGASKLGSPAKPAVFITLVFVRSKRSTLAHTNEHRTHELLESVPLNAVQIPAACPRHHCRLKNSSTASTRALSLCLSLSDGLSYHQRCSQIARHN